MSELLGSPEELQDKYTWEQYETDYYARIDKARTEAFRNTGKRGPLVTSQVISHPSERISEDGKRKVQSQYRYSFKETGYGFYIRVRDGREAGIDAEGWPEIDTTAISSRKMSGISEYVIKFVKGDSSTDGKPTCSLLLNPTLEESKKPKYKQFVEIPKEGAKKPVLQNIQIPIPEQRIDIIVNNEEGILMPPTHPALDFGERVWQHLERVLK